jgi:glucose/arabinose dehydrogenase
MYVSVGSYGNVDADSERSRIRRFSGMDAASVASVEYSTGEVFADGLRNEVGLELDKTGNYIFGVENGPDNLDRQDLGGSSINDDAAAEELNR